MIGVLSRRSHVRSGWNLLKALESHLASKQDFYTKEVCWRPRPLPDMELVWASTAHGVPLSLR
jgi:hypothetical protein